MIPGSLSLSLFRDDKGGKESLGLSWNIIMEVRRAYVLFSQATRTINPKKLFSIPVPSRNWENITQLISRQCLA